LAFHCFPFAVSLYFDELICFHQVDILDTLCCNCLKGSLVIFVPNMAMLVLTLPFIFLLQVCYNYNNTGGEHVSTGRCLVCAFLHVLKDDAVC
jgi:hypothetical protein